MKRNLVTAAVVVAVLAGLTAFNIYFNQPRQTEAQEAETEETTGKLDSMQEQLAKTLAEGQAALAAEKDDVAPPPPLPEDVPDVYQARFETTKGPFVIEVHKDWAPLAARRFYQLVKEGFFTEARFFRVVPRFVVQFGLSGDPEVNKRWRNADLPDEPVKQSNTEGYVSFAAGGPNTRTTQVFINTGNNAQLDHYQQGFPPFGRVIEGMDVVKSFNAKYGEQPSSAQTFISSQGNKFLDERFPGLDAIKTASIVSTGVELAPSPTEPQEPDTTAPESGTIPSETTEGADGPHDSRAQDAVN